MQQVQNKTPRKQKINQIWHLQYKKKTKIQSWGKQSPGIFFWFEKTKQNKT